MYVLFYRQIAEYVWFLQPEWQRELQGGWRLALPEEELTLVFSSP